MRHLLVILLAISLLVVNLLAGCFSVSNSRGSASSAQGSASSAQSSNRQSSQSADVLPFTVDGRLVEIQRLPEDEAMRWKEYVLCYNFYECKQENREDCYTQGTIQYTMNLMRNYNELSGVDSEFLGSSVGWLRTGGKVTDKLVLVTGFTKGVGRVILLFSIDTDDGRILSMSNDAKEVMDFMRLWGSMDC